MATHKLTKIRNKRIIEMFHEFHDVKRMRLDDALDLLSKDYFYLDTNYIYSLIFYDKENHAYYCRLQNERATPAPTNRTHSRAQ
ncbi:hypothetical protein EZS27_005342 [termite gut metagenome]|uniref:Uncharacterized protein n=1 Tax=termite gut metagenome TaxID=433724 RepID=A0A5J4SP66_9ZZZZ